MVGVTTLLLAAVDSAGGKASVALAADHLLAVVLGGKGLEGGLDDTTTEAEDEVEGRLCSNKGGAWLSPNARFDTADDTLLDVVVREGAAVLELLAGEDEALLVRGDALLVLDLGLDVLNRVGRLDLEGDGLAGQGLDENLHACGRQVIKLGKQTKKKKISQRQSLQGVSRAAVK